MIGEEALKRGKPLTLLGFGIMHCPSYHHGFDLKTGGPGSVLKVKIVHHEGS
jgi:hypothetical protein